MFSWVHEVQRRHESGEAFVIVTIAATRGSVPREAGAKMLVTATETFGSIGGGQLEYQCTGIASRALASGADRFVRRFPLGTNCGQCCGGVASVLFEPVAARDPVWLAALTSCVAEATPVVTATSLEPGTELDKLVVTTDSCFPDCPAHLAGSDLLPRVRQLLQPDSKAEKYKIMTDDGVREFLLEPVGSESFDVAVFGAGHVGSALVALLATLPCRVRWIESRQGFLPGNLPDNVAALVSPDPQLDAQSLPAGSFALVMTHSHAMDLEICARLLARDDLNYTGLIGSVSKRRNFERRLRKLGVPASKIGDLVCPIGIPGIGGKAPTEIAISVAGEILKIRSEGRVWKRISLTG